MMFSAIAFTALAGCSMMSSKNQNGSMDQSKTSTTAPDQGAAMNTTMSGADAPSASASFMRLDANHDGFVSKDEYTVNGNTGQSFDGCDTNHDGKLDRAEFMQCAMQPQSTKPGQQ